MTDDPTTTEPPPRARSVDRRRALAAFAGLCLLGVLLLRLWLKWGGPLPGDRWAQVHIGQVDWQQPWRDLGRFFSVIGGQPVAFLTGCVALWFVGRGVGRRGVAFVALACTGVFVNMLLKVLSGPTPLMVERFGEPAPGLNYPSGHTVYGVVMFGSLAWLAWANRRRDVAVVLVALLVAMGPFRVVTDAHFVSDVVAGYLFGFAWLIGCALLTGAGGASPRLSIWRRAA